jgi:hypothetical protein
LADNKKLESSIISRYFENQYGLDIETTGLGGLDSRDNRVVQIGIQSPTGTSYELNILQRDNELAKFHQGKGRLAEYYKQSGVDLTKASPLASRGSYISGVMKAEEAMRYAQDMTKFGNSPVNVIIHNANYEIKHLNRLFKGNSPFDYTQEYKDLRDANRAARADDIQKFKAGRISAADVRAKDVERQVKVYRQIVKDAQKGGAIIDTMEIAKTANALAQQKGIIPATGDLALGTNVEFLAKTFLGETESHIAIKDVRQQNKLAPQLVNLVETLMNDGQLSAKEMKWAESWKKNALHMKVDSTKRAIQQAVDTIESGATFKFASGRMATRDPQEFIDYLSRSGKFGSAISQGDRIIDYGVSQEEIVKRALGQLDSSPFASLKPRGKMPMISGRAKLAMGAAAAMVGIAGLISGDDEDYNTIEGLRHGWFGESRKYLTDFGSGYQGKDYSVVAQPQQNLMPAFGVAGGTIAAGLGAGYLFNKPTSVNVNSLSYMGQAPEGFANMAEFLGREKATFGDLLYAGIRRGEYAMGGFPKAFSVSTYLSQHIYKDAQYSLDLTKRTSSAYTNYLNRLTGRDLLREGITSVEYKGGQLLAGAGSKKGNILLKEARLIQAVHDSNITTSKAQLAKSFESIMGSTGVGREFPLLIAGGDSKLQAGFRNMHAYAHESLSKYLRLVDDPAAAMRDMLPDTDKGLIAGVKKLTRYAPKMGVGGEKNLVGTVPQLLGRHAYRALPILVGLPAAYGMVDWAVRQMFDDDTVAGRAGMTGILSETARAAHMSFGYVSDVMGLTGLRKAAEEQAPGMTGVQPFLGLALSGGLTGMFAGAGFGLYKEIAAKESYEQLVKNKTLKSAMPKFLSKIPGMKGEYTRVGRWARVGLAVGAALGLPSLLAGLGSDKSVDELNEEYLEGKEVAVKKGRWWEFGMTPFEGSKTMYYRPNWYNRVLSQSKRKSMYGDEDISPLGRLTRSLIDPYWEEKRNYEDRPYPVAGPSGEGLGIFGTLYERTIGQIIKPPAYMHLEDMPGAMPTGDATGGVGIGGDAGIEAMSPYSLKQDLKQQYYSTYEAVGLRGFLSSVVKEAVTGERELFQDTPILQSSADMMSSRRAFWDLNLGGGVGLTEPLRRFIPNRPYTDEIINPIKNTMPAWMPGEEYFKDFSTGDPYTKIPEGEYRLPGAGYEARYPELKGTDPEKYPMIHQYKILADVAPYSRKLKAKQRALQRRFDEGLLNAEEEKIFQETQAQLEDRMQARQFNPESNYKGLFGTYTRTVAEMAMKNPLEHLSPLSPAHKFLPAMDVLDEYEEEIFAKEFKPWEQPISAYIKPFLHRTGNIVGLDVVPEELEDARQIEEYFDQLKYVKYRRLEEIAKNEGRGGDAYKAKMKYESTLIGSDVYSEDFSPFALPKREREFYDAFMQAPDKDKERILELVPRNTRELYIAQWDEKLSQDVQEGKMDLTEKERQEVLQQIENRKSRIRQRRRDRREFLENYSEDLPPDDWIGWSAEVDLKDVKLQYIQNTGRDHHFYNLWEDRLRKLRRKPAAMAAAEGINPEQPLIDRPESSEISLLEQAHQAGLRDVRISKNASGSNNSVNVEYDHTQEEDLLLREMGYVV